MFRSFWPGRSPETSIAPPLSDSASYSRPADRTGVSDGRVSDAEHPQPFSSGGRTRTMSDRREGGTSSATVDFGQHQGTPARLTGEASVQGSVSRQQQPRQLRTPRSPRSASAIEDGRKYLSAYREQRNKDRALTPTGSTAATGNTPNGRGATITNGRRASRGSGGGSGSGSASDALSVPLGLTATFSERIERYQTCAPGHARSLEIGLKSCPHNANFDAIGSTENNSGNQANGRHSQGETESSPDSGKEENYGGNGGESEVRLSCTARPSPRTASSSPVRLTPEAVRQAAQTSQADFLSTVLPDTEQETGASGVVSPQASPTVLTNERRYSASSADAAPSHRRHPSHADSAPGKNVKAGSTRKLAAAADETAVERWTSLQRLQDQSLGLGTAAEHHLRRALELCRDVRRMKGGALGHEGASSIDALQAALRGLEEVLTKIRVVDKAARRETQTLGGPAVLSFLHDAGDNTSGPASEVLVDEGIRSGWVSGEQVKAFEEGIVSRSTLEIAALESERRKLKAKVEMFQRQVQFLQRESAERLPPVRNETKASRNGDTHGRFGGGDGIGHGGLRSGESPGFASLLDARLGDEHHLQATLEAEVQSLRGSLEEKDGLIDALRHALRLSASTQQATTGGAETRDDPEPSPAVAAGEPSSLDGSSVSSRRHTGRSSRSGRLLHAAGPIATSRATATAAAAAAAAAGRVNNAPRMQPNISISSSVRKDDETDAEEKTEALNGTPAVQAGGEGTGGEAVVTDSTPPEKKGVAEGFQDTVVTSNGDEAAAAAARARIASWASSGTPKDGERKVNDAGSAGGGIDDEEGEGGSGGVMSAAAAVPGLAWGAVWGSARAMGSTVGLGGGASKRKEASAAARHRGGSSHAVLIL